MEESKIIAQLQGLTGGYNSGHPIVSNVCANFYASSTTAILGPNGAGKTTILRALLGRLPWLTGTVSIMGEPLQSLSTRQRAQVISYVSVSHPESHMSVLQNCILGRTAHRSLWSVTDSPSDKAIAREALELVGIAHLADSTLSDLSEGQRKLAYLARAVAQSPSLLLLDEPTANLDPKNSHEVLSAIKQIARLRNIAVVAVVHDLNVASAWADNVILMKDGQVVSSGTPSEVLTEESLSSTYGILIEECTPKSSNRKIFSAKFWDLCIKS